MTIELSDIEDFEYPAWVDSSALCDSDDIESICHGGCASGAYMPAVTYYTANQTMAAHGDDVLQFIEDSYGELPEVPNHSGWSAIAVFYLSVAVELWASNVQSQLEGLDDE